MFQPGDSILRKIPGLGSFLSSSWEGPYKVIARISDVNYKIGPADGKSSHVKIIHINQMKKCVEDSSNPCYKVLAIIDNEGITNDSLIPDSFKDPDLSPSQKKELDSCFSKYPGFFLTYQAAQPRLLIKLKFPVINLCGLLLMFCR